MDCFAALAMTKNAVADDVETGIESAAGTEGVAAADKLQSHRLLSDR
jgi:hypothetical protein